MDAIVTYDTGERMYVTYPADVTFSNGDTKRVEIMMPRKPFDFREMERKIMARFNEWNTSDKVIKVHIFRNFKEGGVIIRTEWQRILLKLDI